MSNKKELETALRLTDEMILIPGIVLIEHEMRLMQWNKSEEIQIQLEALEGIIYDVVKQCTQTATAETLYLELSSMEKS